VKITKVRKFIRFRQMKL